LFSNIFVAELHFHVLQPNKKRISYVERERVRALKGTKHCSALKMLLLHKLNNRFNKWSFLRGSDKR
jgi:hypothetical protein